MPSTLQFDQSLENTDRRIRAYLAALIPLEGIEVPGAWHRGRAIVEELANSSSGTNPPTKKLTLLECADAIAFMHNSGVRDVSEFHADRDDVPSVQCGQMLALMAIEEALRSPRGSRPENLEDRLNSIKCHLTCAARLLHESGAITPDEEITRALRVIWGSADALDQLEREVEILSGT